MHCRGREGPWISAEASNTRRVRPAGHARESKKDWSERSRKPEVDWLLSPKQNGHRINLDQEVLQMS